MQKLATFILMLCLTFSGAFCHASGVAGHENKKVNDGTPIEIIKNSSHSSSEKSSSIQAIINGHTLTVVFTENLGQVNVEITTASGALVQVMWVSTSDGWQTNLLQTGDYIVTFTLSNGDEYYGEFSITD